MFQSIKGRLAACGHKVKIFKLHNLLAHESDACFCNVCVTEKNEKNKKNITKCDDSSKKALLQQI